LPAEEGKRVEYEDGGAEQQILVEKEADHARQSEVAQPAMHLHG